MFPCMIDLALSRAARRALNRPGIASAFETADLPFLRRSRRAELIPMCMHLAAHETILSCGSVA